MQHTHVQLALIKQWIFVYNTEALLKPKKISQLYLISEKVRLTNRKSMNHEAATTHNEE
jgi:hypothetical protein